MRASIIAFVILCGIIAGTVVFLNRQKVAPPAPAPIVKSASSPTAPSEKMAVPIQAPPPTISQSADKTAQIPVTAPVASETKPDNSTNAIAEAVDALLAAKGAGEKHELFQQLLKSGQMDAAIAELKQRAAQNPDDPEIPTTIGEALINKVGAIHAAGGDINEQGILAMQADQSFNAALKIDPNNYEAQLVKSISMTYWPAEPARDAQVVQTLSGLIDRQETMLSQPGFAQTYIYLGNEYQKIGQPEKAAATWQLGAQKFPSDPVLQKKINGQ
jgi:tetratricopeptide (TPR) repeat protein